MNLPGLSVRRPVFTTMVTLIVVILGAVSLQRLRIDMLPNIELPRLTVRSTYEGASPEVVERLITQIAEEIVATVPGVDEIVSDSMQGRSDVRVQFTWGTDLDVAAQDVQARLEEEANEFPDDMPRPRISKFDIASFPVVILGVSSALDPVELTELIENQIRYRFARLPGVAQVDTWGGYMREVRIELDPERVNALRLPLDRVLQSIRDANLDLPAGNIESGRYEVTLRAPAEFRDLGELRNTVVSVRDGAPVTLGQIATVRDTYERLTRIVRVNGERGLRIGIRKQADANTVEVSRRILAEIDEVNRDFPQLQIVAVSNQGNFIERSIQNVASSVLYGGAFAVLVLLLFLRSVRSTAVISLAIPISAIATFALIYFGGLTLNLMTLGGLALGVGMMVDSSIVVLENVFRRRTEDGEAPRDAAVNGAVEVGPAIVASTITTLVIFLPLAFVRGVTGLLFQELAYVIVFSLVCALLVALSVIPMLAARMLRGIGEPIAEGRGSGLARALGKRLDALDLAYRDLVRLALRHRTLTATLSVASLGASLLLLPRIGTEFLPPSDEGEVRVSGEMELGTRLGLIDRQTGLLEDAVRRTVPEAVAIVSSSRGGATGDAVGDVQVSLVPAAQRARSNVAVADALRGELAGRVPGMEIRTRAPQGQFLLDRLVGGGSDGVTVDIRGYDLETLGVLADQVAARVADVPGVTDVDTSRDDGVPQQMIHIDRDKAADLGLSPRDVARALETAVAGTRAGDFRVAGNSYRILVQFRDAEQLSIDQILDLTLRTPTGQDVALRSVVATEPGQGPVVIRRKDQRRIVTVTANVSGRPLGSVAAEIDTMLDQIARPPGYDLEVSGGFEEQQRSFHELALSLLLALVLVYMALACQYESLRDPLVVMFSVPFAAIGVLTVLFLTRTTLNVQSYIGCIMLGGIVVNNAILLVDQANRLRDRLGSREAIAEAARRRLRPILMTTSTTVLGLVPLAIGIGEGSEAQAPLARAVVGGLCGSTLVTLVLIPVVYTLFHPERRGPASG
ncbi:MAG: efflux RND transporter permease subunit [Planctomycetes bacterium]|nr:efflux RND transporter permease subunit [Planctomycetota bacterium]